MGLLDSIFKNTGSSQEQPKSTTSNRPAKNPYEKNGILNLQKNDILNLTKIDDSLKNIRVAAGWDVNKGFGYDYDLDLCAYLRNQNGKVKRIVYFGRKRANGIYLDGDNLTGEGVGDDENIYCHLNKLDDEVDSVVFAVVIYSAHSKKQYFSKVKNAYVRLVNEDNNYQVCRYNLSKNGEDNTAVIAAKIFKQNGAWCFQAIEEYHNVEGIRELTEYVEDI